MLFANIAIIGGHLEFSLGTLSLLIWDGIKIMCANFGACIHICTILLKNSTYLHTL